MLAFMETAKKMSENKKQGRRTLLVCFYSGHGINRGGTKAMCNPNEKGKQTEFPVETNLKLLRQYNGSYVIGLLSCNRQQWEVPLRGGADEDQAPQLQDG